MAVEKKCEPVSPTIPVVATSEPSPAELPPPPLDQRTRRKNRRNPDPAVLLPATVTPQLPDSEKEDLNFLESLTRAEGRTHQASVEDDESISRSEAISSGTVCSGGGGAAAAAAAATVVVPVQIVAEKDKKELEDWLDDFLSD